MNVCFKCKKQFPRQMNGYVYKSNVCDECALPKEIGFPKPFNTVFLDDYGNISAARLDEIQRRVVLPDAKPGGGYYLGRRGENGKIQDRAPDYRP